MITRSKMIVVLEVPKGDFNYLNSSLQQFRNVQIVWPLQFNRGYGNFDVDCHHSNCSS